MDGGRQSTQPVEKRGRRSIQKFIANTKHAALLDRTHLAPVTIGYYLFQWNPVASAAPGCHKHVRIF